MTTETANPHSASPLVTMPLVTMIVVCYNQSRFVLETLESVKAQTYKNTQLIIIDDCSSDDSVAIIDRWLQENDIQCTFIRHQKNQGICKSLNDVLAVATGKYISMIAADDVWLPDKIAQQVEIMESQPESVGVLYSDAFQMDEDGRASPGTYITTHWKFAETPQGYILDSLLDSNFIPGMTTLIRRSCYDTVGLYDENLHWEDWDMWLRMARHYSFVYSSTPAAKYRIHSRSFSRSDYASMVTGSIKILLKQFSQGNLSEEQESKVMHSLAVRHLEAANFARLNGNRSDAVKHLVECVRSAKLRLPGGFVAWTSILAYVFFGLKRLRWWKGSNPARS